MMAVGTAPTAIGLALRSCCATHATLRASQLFEPPTADPHGGWCGGWGLETPGYPIARIYQRDPLCNGDYKGKIHPTQKPVKLYEWLLTNYAKQGQRILDTHLGSGSSAIAAHYGGFDFVGCELDTDYYNAAKERFNNATAQIALFGA